MSCSTKLLAACCVLISAVVAQQSPPAQGHTVVRATAWPLTRPMVVEIAKDTCLINEDVIEAFRALLRGDAKTEVVRNHLCPDITQMVSVHGSARVSFDPNRLWEPGEEHTVP